MSEEHKLKICPACGSSNATKSGRHYHKKGAVQRYRCKICGISWSSGGYFKHKFPNYVINEAINYYQEGLSLEKVVDKIKKNFGYVLTRTSVLDWIKKANVTPRSRGQPKNMETQVNREVIQIFTPVTVFHSSSLSPMKIIMLEEEVE